MLEITIKKKTRKKQKSIKKYKLEEKLVYELFQCMHSANTKVNLRPKSGFDDLHRSWFQS